MNPSRLIADLRDLGVTLVVRNGELRARGPEDVLTPEVCAVIKTYRGPLLATVSGRPVPSSEFGIVWCPGGGVRLAEPHDLRSLALTRAGELPDPFPAMDLEMSGAIVESGRRAWWQFCGTAPIEAVAEAALVMDDPEQVRAAEARAISLLFWEPPVTRPTSPHAASVSPSPPVAPPTAVALRAADVAESAPPRFNKEVCREG